MSFQENEIKLIKRCARNDRQAQKIIYEHFFPVMFQVCRRYVKNGEDTIEALNNGFLKVFKNIGQFNFEGSFEGWIKRIIVNTSIDFLRTNKKYREHIVLEEKLMMVETDTENGPSIHLEEIESQIEKLPELLKIIFKLYAQDGYLHREIADMLDINENTSRWYFLNAKKQLQNSLKVKMASDIQPIPNVQKA